MKLTYKNYEIVPCGQVAPGRYDLAEKRILTAKEGKKSRKGVAIGDTYEKTIDIAYGLTVESAVGHIMSLELAKTENILELTQFLRGYKAESENLLKNLKILQ